MKKTVLVAVVLAAVMFATVAWSQGEPGGTGNPGGPIVPGGPGGPGNRPGNLGGAGGFGGPGMMMRGIPASSCPAATLAVPRTYVIDPLTRMAQLTETQAAQLKDLLTKWEATLPPLQKKAGDAQQALRMALIADPYDAQKVKDAATAAQTAEGAIITASIDQWTQIRTILKVEQVRKLIQIMNPYQGRMNGPPMGNPPGGDILPPPPAAGGTPTPAPGM